MEHWRSTLLRQAGALAHAAPMTGVSIATDDETALRGALVTLQGLVDARQREMADGARSHGPCSPSHHVKPESRGAPPSFAFASSSFAAHGPNYSPDYLAPAYSPDSLLPPRPPEPSPSAAGDDAPPAALSGSGSAAPSGLTGASDWQYSCGDAVAYEHRDAIDVGEPSPALAPIIAENSLIVPHGNYAMQQLGPYISEGAPGSRASGANQYPQLQAGQLLSAPVGDYSAGALRTVKSLTAADDPKGAWPSAAGSHADASHDPAFRQQSLRLSTEPPPASSASRDERTSRDTWPTRGESTRTRFVGPRDTDAASSHEPATDGRREPATDGRREQPSVRNARPRLSDSQLDDHLSGGRSRSPSGARSSRAASPTNNRRATSRSRSPPFVRDPGSSRFRSVGDRHGTDATADASLTIDDLATMRPRDRPAVTGTITTCQYGIHGGLSRLAYVFVQLDGASLDRFPSLFPTRANLFIHHSEFTRSDLARLREGDRVECVVSHNAYKPGSLAGVTPQLL